MELSPRLDHWFVRPKLFTKLYINNILQTEFDFSNMRVTGKKLPLKNHSLDLLSSWLDSIISRQKRYQITSNNLNKP